MPCGECGESLMAVREGHRWRYFECTRCGHRQPREFPVGTDAADRGGEREW